MLAPDLAAAPARVLMTADAVGGVWRYALELARGLAGSGTDVVLAIMGPPATPEQLGEAAAIEGVLLVEGSFDLEWMPGADEDVLRSGAWLMELEAAYTPDLVHLNGYAHAALPWQAPVVVVAHSCVLSWWQAVHGAEAPPEWDGYRRRTAAGLQAADLVVAPTRAFLRTIESLYGPGLRSRVIWNGRNPPNIECIEKQPIIFAAGRIWDAAKNLKILASVAKDLPWPVCVAGPGVPERGDCAALARNIRWLGALPPAALNLWLAQTAVFVAPSRYEPFGLAVLEAALSGCALVLGDIPTLRELWTGAAIFVPPDDREQLAYALGSLTEDDDLRVTLGRLAKERAASFSAARMTAAYRHAYAEVLAAHSGAIRALAN
jgi:glycosyltransferase involved in cell wall biosynthesis